MCALGFFVVSRNLAIAWMVVAACWCKPAAAAPAPTSAILADEPITAVPSPPPQDTLRIVLGERLFRDVRLSRDNSRSCATCHDLADNGATRNASDAALDGSALRFNTTTIFNAALNFRLGWEGEFRSLEDHTEATIRKSTIMDSSPAQAAAKLAADPDLVRQFTKAYGRGPNPQNLLNAIATFERSLLTPGSRFDRWLAGDTAALSTQELSGYRLFKSLGCAACHQGVNVGGNLYQRNDALRRIDSSSPQIVRVPSLRNVATTAPYFHDGSAPTLQQAAMCVTTASHPDLTLSMEHAEDIAAFLRTLTGTYRGRRVGASQ